MSSSSSSRPSPLPRFAYALDDTSAAAAASRHEADNDSNVRLIDAAAALAAADMINKHHVQANSAAITAYPLQLPDALEASDTPRETSSSTSTSLPTLSSTGPSTASSTPRVPTGSRIQFFTKTTAPSPPAPPRHDPESISQSPQAHHLTTSRIPHGIDCTNGFATPSRNLSRPSLTLQRKTSASSINLKPISRTPSLKTSLSGIFGSPSAASSTYPSPVISAMGDVTPLPSPLMSNGSPGPWKKLDRHPSSSNHRTQTEGGTPTTPDGAIPFPPTSRKGYPGLSSGPAPGGISLALNAQQQNGQPHHTRNRSISDYVPDPTLIPKRMLTVSGTHATGELKGVETSRESHMRREPHLSEARGLTPIEKPPTPPRSESSHSVSDQSTAETTPKRDSIEPSRYEYFEAYGRCDGKRRRWRAIGQLGQGTFSRVMLATSQMVPSASEKGNPIASNGLIDPKKAAQIDRKTLVAIKVCEHGPRGGASEERIEMSLKRELEIMQVIRHPSLIHLKAWNIETTRAILVLSYCAGGDLFDLANGHRSLLQPGLLRRIFAEAVGAVLYLHDQLIVHRDIKLENVLVNLPLSELADTTIDWTTYPHSVITLADLGLSRRITPDEKLETRCGSDDYAAPEVILGMPYDGRMTDAWSLGVLLYALLEGRLPFDFHSPTSDYHTRLRMRSRTSHRIARVEWHWVQYGVTDDKEEGDGDHGADNRRFEKAGLLGAKEAVEMLLRRQRSRLPLSAVAKTEWVAGGIQVDGGIKFREEEEGEEVS